MKRACNWLIAATFLLGTATSFAAGPATDDSLYQALGGKAGITAIVNGMLNNVADDMRIVHYFADANIVNTQHGLVTKLCAVAGGPCHYDGLNMVDVHRGLHITPAAFNALVEDLQAAMTHLKIPLATQNRLLARLVPMRNQIVEH
ncbi:MAG TPA: group 1 truncated hemoglobin [Gammaproteobacteria bacterium]|nr:group 1 truncated hemoglobin [Gammaproteobacteria bacterium]